jgi:hypothetical protein
LKVVSFEESTPSPAAARPATVSGIHAFAQEPAQLLPWGGSVDST